MPKKLYNVTATVTMTVKLEVLAESEDDAVSELNAMGPESLATGGESYVNDIDVEDISLYGEEDEDE